MYNLYLINACYLILFLKISSAQVLVAGNEDAFRSLAKNFVPQQFANQLASLMTQATDVNNDNVYYDNERDEDNNKDYANQEDQQENYDNYYTRPVAKDYKKPRTVQVNLDELVEKVKDRILSDFRTTIPQPRANLYRPEIEDGDSTGQSLAKSFKKPGPIERLQGSVNKPNQFKKKLAQQSQVAGKNVESHDLYEKVKLSKGKGQKDSYEDYVIPKKEYDLFESEERGKTKSNNKQGYSKESDRQSSLKGRQGLDKRTTRRLISFDSPLDDNQRQTDKKFNSINRQTTPNYDDNDKYNNKKKNGYDRENLNNKNQDYRGGGGNNKNRDDYDTNRNRNNNNSNKNRENKYNDNLRTTKYSTQKTTRVEYVDDDYHTQGSTADQEPKAMTEFIGGDDYKDEPLPSTQRTQNGYQNTKRVSKKIVTNMPTRERFKMSTPNYYEKLPRIAEKYNFDEPIPERDQEAENLKPIGHPAAAINGKIKV